MTLTGAQNNQKRGKRAEYDDDRAEFKVNATGAAATTGSGGAVDYRTLDQPAVILFLLLLPFPFLLKGPPIIFACGR